MKLAAGAMRGGNNGGKRLIMRHKRLPGRKFGGAKNSRGRKTTTIKRRAAAN
jgi:hypothetical protein